MILAIFELPVTMMLSTKFPVNWPFGSGEEAKNRFSRFRIGTISAIFDLQVTSMFPIKLQVKWPFSSGGEAKNRFSRWMPWQSFWISNWNDFSYF